VADHELQTRIVVERPAQDESKDVDGGIDVPTPGRGRQSPRDLSWVVAGREPPPGAPGLLWPVL